MCNASRWTFTDASVVKETFYGPLSLNTKKKKKKRKEKKRKSIDDTLRWFDCP